MEFFFLEVKFENQTFGQSKKKSTLQNAIGMTKVPPPVTHIYFVLVH